MSLKTRIFPIALSLGIGGLLAFAMVASGMNNRTMTKASVSTSHGQVLLPQVLAKTQSPYDVLPSAIRDHANSFGKTQGVPIELQNGDIYVDQSRLAVSGAGAQKYDAYVMPSERGGPCFVWSNGLGGCAGDLSRERPLSMGMADNDGFGRGAATFVNGIVIDNITSIDVEVDGSLLDTAQLTNNVYYFEAEGVPTAIIARFDDGSSKRFEFPDLSKTASQ